MRTMACEKGNDSQDQNLEGFAFEFSPLLFSLSKRCFLMGFPLRLFEGVFFTSEFRSGIKKQ